MRMLCKVGPYYILRTGSYHFFKWPYKQVSGVISPPCINQAALHGWFEAIWHDFMLRVVIQWYFWGIYPPIIYPDGGCSFNPKKISVTKYAWNGLTILSECGFVTNTLFLLTFGLDWQRLELRAQQEIHHKLYKSIQIWDPTGSYTTCFFYHHCSTSVLKPWGLHQGLSRFGQISPRFSQVLKACWRL